MREMSVKKIVLSCIAFGAALFTLIGLAFQVIRLGWYGYSGFDFVSFKIRFYGGYDWASILIGVLCLLQLLAALTLIILNTIALFMFGEQRAKTTALASVIVCIIFNVLYMAEGIAVSQLSGFQTLSYVSFILNVLFTVAFFVCMGVLKYKRFGMGGVKSTVGVREARKQECAVSKSTSQSIGYEKDAIELLTEYKKLLDAGIITQEEFDKKKSELL